MGHSFLRRVPNRGSVGAVLSRGLVGSLAAVALLVPRAYADAPTCLGSTATIYVESGVIVGGPDSGAAYVGMLNGTSGDDVIVGTDGSDIIIVSNGNDLICGGNGIDTLDDSADVAAKTWTISSANAGTVGASTFSAVEKLSGGSGDDEFQITSNSAGVASTINGGAGTDTLDFTGRTLGVQVNLSGTASATGGISSIENATGGSGNDVIYGDSTANVLDGGASGNDILIGRGGDDILIGGSGRDLLIGGIAQDSMEGGDADDILIAGTTSYDSTISALTAIMMEWGRPDAIYAVRVKHLQGTLGGGLNGSYRLNSATVFNDGATDNLTGGTGLDWFLTSAGDGVADLHTGGTETQSNF